MVKDAADLGALLITVALIIFIIIAGLLHWAFALFGVGLILFVFGVACLSYKKDGGSK